MQGLYLEDFEVGRKFEHALRRTVTEMDNTLFSCLTHNPQPLHIDHEFAASTEWGKPLVNSMFTLGLMIVISVNDTTLGTTIANLGMTETVFPHPLFHGDTVHVETEVVSVRDAGRQASGPKLAELAVRSPGGQHFESAIGVREKLLALICVRRLGANIDVGGDDLATATDRGRVEEEERQPASRLRRRQVAKGAAEPAAVLSVAS